MKYVFEVLEEVQKAKTKPEKVTILKKNETWALKDVLRGSIDPVIKWHFPKGEVPYTPSEAHNHPTNLLRENKKFIYFAVGGKGDNLPAFKRERPMPLSAAESNSQLYISNPVIATALEV